MGRKKGDLNMATRKRIEDEKAKSAQRNKLFQYHKKVVAPVARADPSLVVMNPGSVVKSAQDVVQCTDLASVAQDVAENSRSIEDPDGGEASIKYIPPSKKAKRHVQGMASHHQDNQEVTKTGTEDIDPNNQWLKELILLKYNTCNIESPSFAVQTIIACIRNKEIHSYITFKEVNLTDKSKSLVTFFGFNGWFSLYQKMKKVNFDFTKCKEYISTVYNEANSIFFQRTVLEDNWAMIFMECLPALEDANDIDNSLQEDSAVTSENQHEKSECLFSENDLFETEYVEKGNAESETPNDGTEADNGENVPNLNLANSSCFPVITEQSVECYSVVYDHAIWRSLNFGALAPISIETWCALAGVTKEEIKTGNIAAHKMERYFEKLDIDIPFDMDFFNMPCSKNNGIQVMQKGHMAYPNIERNDYYLKRIWRTHCPYFTCRCQKNMKLIRKKEDKCGTGIIWFDHAIWFALNNLEAIYPDISPIAKMVALTKCINESLRPAVLAYISYLEVRRIMLEMTLAYAKTPEKKLKIQFGNDKLADICEKTIKPITFLKNQNSGYKPAFAARSYSGRGNSAVVTKKIAPKFPPRITQDPKNIGTDPIQPVTPGIIANSSNEQDEYSITKGGNKSVALNIGSPKKLEKLMENAEG